MQINYSYVSDLPFKNFCKLAKQAETIKNKFWFMIKHCLGNSQINSIPAWSKQFSYITFLYRTLAKVYALARVDIIHSQREIKEIFDPENSPFHCLGVFKYIEELWFLIPCHRCEKSALENLAILNI